MPTQPLALSSSSSLSILLSRSHSQGCPAPCQVHAFPPSALRSIALLTVQTCTAPCGIHVFPPSALLSIHPVGRRHTCVSCYCSCGFVKCLLMAVHHRCACICFAMLLHLTTVKDESAQAVKAECDHLAGSFARARQGDCECRQEHHVQQCSEAAAD